MVRMFDFYGNEYDVLYSFMHNDKVAYVAYGIAEDGSESGMRSDHPTVITSALYHIPPTKKRHEETTRINKEITSLNEKYKALQEEYEKLFESHRVDRNKILQEEFVEYTESIDLADDLAYQVAWLIRNYILDPRSRVSDALLHYLRIGSLDGPSDMNEWLLKYEAKMPHKKIEGVDS